MKYLLLTCALLISQCACANNKTTAKSAKGSDTVKVVAPPPAPLFTDIIPQPLQANTAGGQRTKRSPKAGNSGNRLGKAGGKVLFAAAGCYHPAGAGAYEDITGADSACAQRHRILIVSASHQAGIFGKAHRLGRFLGELADDGAGGHDFSQLGFPDSGKIQKFFVTKLL